MKKLNLLGLVLCSTLILSCEKNRIEKISGKYTVDMEFDFVDGSDLLFEGEELIIEESDDEDKGEVKLNFSNIPGYDIYADIKRKNVTISAQSFEDENRISGEGTLSDDEVDLELVWVDIDCDCDDRYLTTKIKGKK